VSALRRALATAFALGAGLSACGGDDEQPSAPKGADGAVAIKTFQFKPDPVRVRAGTAVRWENQDDIEHTVTAGTRGKATGEFDKKLNLGDAFSHTFAKAGTYAYVCTIHMGMDGGVIVG